MKRISNSYVTTLDPMSANDMQTLEMLRKTVRMMNELHSDTKRVVVRGRRPIAKKEVYNIYTGKTRTLSYDYCGNVVGGLANASQYDVYIY
jgi:ribosomal protein S2